MSLIQLLLLIILQVTDCTVLIEEYSCYNTLFEATCSDGETLVFETAHYGRNDTIVAELCEIPYTRNCDIDVHFLLNRACAGRQRCSIGVNSAFFGDPCGYEEFLKASYYCVPVTAVKNNCLDAGTTIIYNEGYITSPNYPNNYYMDAECRWLIRVQSMQHIRITLFDFELDVKRSGHCHDLLEVSLPNGRSLFRDCGALGKQVISVEGSNEAFVIFKTGQTSLTQRGFLLKYEAVGPGCPSIPSHKGRSVSYYAVDDVFYANITCSERFHFDDVMMTSYTSVRIVRCADYFWSETIQPCIENFSHHPTSPLIYTLHSHPPTDLSNPQSLLNRSASVVGVALGTVTAALLALLLLMLTMYCCHRRCCVTKLRKQSAEQWNMVINNLHENVINDVTEHHCTCATLRYTDATPTHHKTRRQSWRTHTGSTLQEDWTGVNLLTSHQACDDVDETLEYHQEPRHCTKTDDSSSCVGMGDQPGLYQGYNNQCRYIHQPLLNHTVKDRRLESPLCISNVYITTLPTRSKDSRAPDLLPGSGAGTPQSKDLSIPPVRAFVSKIHSISAPDLGDLIHCNDSLLMEDSAETDYRQDIGQDYGFNIRPLCMNAVKQGAAVNIE